MSETNMIPVGEIKVMGDITGAMLINSDGTQMQAAVDSRVVPATAAALADPATSTIVSQAVDLRAETQVAAALATSPLIPTLLGDPPHSWADPSGRMNLYDKVTGEVVAPAGLETPYAGAPIPDNVTPIAGTYDPVTGRWGQNALRPDGTFFDETVRENIGRLLSEFPDLLAALRDGMGLSTVAATYRTAAVPLTLPGGSGSAPFTSTDTAKHVRWPVRIAAATKRWRLHVRNYNDRGSTAFPGALAVTGVWFGKQNVPANGVLAGAWAAQPTQIQGAFSTAADGSEWVSQWVTDTALQIQPHAEHMLSLGYTCAAQTNQQGLGGCWTSAVPTDAGVVAPTTALVQQQYSPLDVWLEVEVDSRVPVGMFLGDSLTAGTGAALPVRDSYANRWALANGAIAQIAAHHGSTLDEWSSAGAWKWQKYASLTAPDFVYVALGSNDVFNGVALGTVQARKQAIDVILRAGFSTRIYLSTLLARNGAATTVEKEAVRVAYNDWLATLPGDAIQLFDVAASVESAAGTIASRYVDPDGVHLNTAGYARNGRAITAPLTVRR